MDFTLMTVVLTRFILAHFGLFFENEALRNPYRAAGICIAGHKLGKMVRKNWGGGIFNVITYESVSKCFRSGRLKRELQMVQLSATVWSCIAIL
jgi:hypothetical protein